MCLVTEVHEGAHKALCACINIGRRSDAGVPSVQLHTVPQDSFFLYLPYVSVVMKVLQQGSSHACASITDNYLLQVLTCT